MKIKKAILAVATVGLLILVNTAFSQPNVISVPIKVDLIPEGRNNRPGTPIAVQYITIHDTANTSVGANAFSHAKYVKNPDQSTNMPNNPAQPKSWQFTVDDTEIYQHLPLSEIGWHAGDGFSGPGNRQSIAIEICENSDGNRAQAEENAAWLTAKLLNDFDLCIGKVEQHNHWNGKDCPNVLRGRARGWEGFLDRVAYYKNRGVATAALGDAPTIPMSGIRLLPTGQFQFEVSGACGHTYEIQVSSNLVNWVTIDTIPRTASSTFSFTDPAAPSLTQQFYRVRRLDNSIPSQQ